MAKKLHIAKLIRSPDGPSRMIINQINEAGESSIVDIWEAQNDHMLVKHFAPSLIRMRDEPDGGLRIAHPAKCVREYEHAPDCRTERGFINSLLSMLVPFKGEGYV